jgi:hypothetical protein
MIYTCYDMIRDCRAGRAEGWSYFIVQYVPVIRKLLAHYSPERPDLEGVLKSLRLFQSFEPAPERAFVAELRQHVLLAVEPREPEIPLDLETLAAALQPLTLVEKETVWFEAMRYNQHDVSRILRMDPKTAETIREKASELIRSRVDAWHRALIAENGLLLGRAAAAQSTPDCLPLKPFLDVIDGRTDWYKREEMERHVIHCWHCIDRFCRAWEVADLLRGSKPLTEEEAAPFRKLLPSYAFG